MDKNHFSCPERNNVDVLNKTLDLYRYFDATKQAEFFFECVAETVNTTLPDEVNYLKKYQSNPDCLARICSSSREGMSF